MYPIIYVFDYEHFFISFNDMHRSYIPAQQTT